jgi:hypothetical protein
MCLFCEKKINQSENLIVVSSIDQTVGTSTTFESLPWWRKRGSVHYHRDCFVSVAGTDITDILDSRSIKTLKFSDQDYEKMTKLAGL